MSEEKEEISEEEVEEINKSSTKVYKEPKSKEVPGIKKDDD